jgi:phosphate/sulfate permease
MATIGAPDGLGLPGSTTHVLSSGVTGTMLANHPGSQGATVRVYRASTSLTRRHEKSAKPRWRRHLRESFSSQRQERRFEAYNLHCRDAPGTVAA